MTGFREPLTVERLSAGYGRRTVISDLSLPPIQAGQLVALVGPNAAGKSTLLRAVAGLVRSAGDIRLGSLDLCGMTPAARARRIGFMPQSLPADISLTVLETMIAVLKVTGIRQENSPVDERALKVLERLNVAYLAPLPLHTLSGGQKQVASLAQTIACGPDILLLDEPVSALDLARRHFIMAAVKDYVSSGRIAVLVLHDLALAADWADEIVILTRRGLHSAGRPEQVITPEMLADVYNVTARVEFCSRGRLQIVVDGVAA